MKISIEIANCSGDTNTLGSPLVLVVRNDNERDKLLLCQLENVFVHALVGGDHGEGTVTGPLEFLEKLTNARKI